MFSKSTKRLLQNVIRHTNAHNRVVEEAEMWQQHGRLKELDGLDPTNPSYLHDDRFNDKDARISRSSDSWHVPFSREGYGRHAHMDDEKPGQRSSSDARRSTYWMRKLEKMESAHPDRWDHSGYKELYPDYFDSDRSQHSSSESKDRKSARRKRRESGRKTKKKKDKHISRSKHKHKKTKHKDQSSSDTDSSSEDSNHRSRHKHKKTRHRDRSSSGTDSSDEDSELGHRQSGATVKKHRRKRSRSSVHSGSRRGKEGSHADPTSKGKKEHSKNHSRHRHEKHDTDSDSDSEKLSDSESDNRKKKRHKKKHRRHKKKKDEGSDSDSRSDTSVSSDSLADRGVKRKKKKHKSQKMEKVGENGPAANSGRQSQSNRGKMDKHDGHFVWRDSAKNESSTRKGNGDSGAGTNGVLRRRSRSSSYSDSEGDNEAPKKKRKF
ncbi:hypothetical protein BaRGS_00013559 [Batillaria attramentaria]|uniref:Uncharacterized protein n=1 Tax=Batillaria attramentaria TaxID=370345 RepID=A0ABD0L6C3_9CAEN